MAFVVVGLPGIAIAALVRFTVREPPRGQSEQLSGKIKPPPFRAVARFIARDGVLRNTIAGGALISFTGYASVIWVPIYLVRIHGMGTGETGTYLALLIGIGGALGIYLGGRLADYLARTKGPQWTAWVAMAPGLVSAPFSWWVFTAQSPGSALLGYVIPAALGTINVAAGFAIVQNRTPLEMRSVSAAINLFIGNIIGLGVGPFAVGLLSDLLQPAYGIDSLRYALLSLIPVDYGVAGTITGRG